MIHLTVQHRSIITAGPRTNLSTFLQWGASFIGGNTTHTTTLYNNLFKTIFTQVFYFMNTEFLLRSKTFII